MRDWAGIFGSDGRVQVVRAGLRPKFFSDLHHYLLRAPWPVLILLFFLTYLGVNVAFATLYWLDGGIENARPGSLRDCFFFSVHTMMTIGYGTMAPGSLSSHILVVIEAFVGLLGAATGTGIVFSKFSRPIARVLFSQNALITPRDGVPSLLFRMANERTAQIVEAELHVMLARNEVTIEGERIRRFHELELARDRTVVFALSWTAIHPITESSPLWGATPEQLSACSAEIVVSFVGIDETSSQTVHARHAYGAKDVLFERRFVDILHRREDKMLVMDYSQFHRTEPLGERRSPA